MFSFARFQQNFDRQKELQKLLECGDDVKIEQVLDMSECSEELTGGNKAVELL